MIKLFASLVAMAEPFVNAITITPQLETIMTHLLTVLAVVAMPLVIGYIYALRSPHRPEYDVIDMYLGIGEN